MTRHRAWPTVTDLAGRCERQQVPALWSKKCSEQPVRPCDCPDGAPLEAVNRNKDVQGGFPNVP
jgi:hypothetical protein